MKHLLSMMALALLAVFVAVAVHGCAPAPAPEPVVTIQKADIAVAQGCNPVLPPRPDLMTKQQVLAAIAGAVTFDDKMKIVTRELVAYIGWVPVIEGGLKGCATVPMAPPK